jgi:two-component system response regulator DesR
MARSGFPLETPDKGDDPVPDRGVPLHQALRPIRLLLVDRDARVRGAIHETITFESDLTLVAEAADAAAARALADRTSPAVALVDLLLPDIGTGLALVHSLSRRPGCAVVAMSGRGGLREAALAAGAFALVDKSGDIDAILNTVRASVGT